MIAKVILNITHSDEYTDYLFMTAGLTNRHIIPMVNPGNDRIKAVKDANTLVMRCYSSRKELTPGDTPVSSNLNTNSIRVLSRFYLNDDDTINTANAEIVRQTIQEMVMNQLMAYDNLCEVYRHHFPVLWNKRQMIYDDPKLFFARSSRYGYGFGLEYIPIGAMLKAIEEDPKRFRISLGGGCRCREKPLLIDYRRDFGENWTLYTWCPACHSRREIKVADFQRYWDCDKSVEDTIRYYDKGQGFSTLNLFDVIDAVSSA